LGPGFSDNVLATDLKQFKKGGLNLKHRSDAKKCAADRRKYVPEGSEYSL